MLFRAKSTIFAPSKLNVSLNTFFTMIYNNIETFCHNVVRNAAITLVIKTSPKMNKRGNPYFGRVEKVTKYSSVVLGRDYGATCAKRSIDGEYEEEKPSGMTWDVYPFILKGDNNPNQRYLRYALNDNATSDSTYFVDGRVATPSEVEVIKSFLPKPSPCQKQIDKGITKEVRVRSVKVENIVTL